jgi:hypothetical protein
MTFGHVQIASTPELSVQHLTNRSQPSTQSLPSMFYSDSGIFRRPRLSKRQESRESSTANERVFTNIKPFPSVSRASQDLNWRHGSLVAPTENSRPRSPSRSKEVPNERPETRRKRSVFAELHESDSAMGLTKKVRCPCSQVVSSSH